MDARDKVLVIGGANVDIKGQSSGFLQRGTSNPGRVWRSPGGVGRNIAENLAAVGVPVVFVTAFGCDAEGDWLRERLEERTVDTSMSLRVEGARTSTYLAIVDDKGELSVAVSDMSITDELSPQALRRVLQSRADVRFICVDTNLSSDALAAVCDEAHAGQIPVVCEPVSVTKAARVRSLVGNLYAVTPNQDELSVLAGMTVSSVEDVVAASNILIQAGTRVVVTTLGAKGSVVVTPGLSMPLPAEPVDPVDVTGAGDAFTAGFVAGLMRDQSPIDAAKYGHQLAAEVVRSGNSYL